MTETPGPSPAGGPSAQESETATIYGRAGVVMMFTALSRVLGMVRDLAIAHWNVSKVYAWSESLE